MGLQQRVGGALAELALMDIWSSGGGSNHCLLRLECQYHESWLPSEL
jgi:hypothetical protein